MKLSDILSLLEEVGIDASRKIVSDKWVSFRCPFARWTHRKGFDRSPSFGISINPDGASMFNCFTCKKKGNLSEMVSELGLLSNRDLSHVSNRIHGSELPECFAPWEAKVYRRLPIYNAMDEELFNSTFYPVEQYGEAKAYLASRHIGRRVSSLLDLRYDELLRRILFKVTYDGDLIGLTGRAIDKDAKPKIKNYPGFSPHSFLLGEEVMVHPPASSYPVVLVEGQFDFARFHQNHGTDYADCLCSMGSSLSHFQLDRLLYFDRPIVFMLDDDEVGRDGTKKAIEALRGKVEYWKADYPHGASQPDDLSAYDMRKAILY